jgi:hypothetical protein
MGEPTRYFPIDGVGLTELRIHGVSGPDPRTTLETAATFRVAGDNITGFVRRTDDDDRGPCDAPSASHRGVEAFSWRGVSSGGASRAAWLLLAPYALLNVAAWMHPVPGDGSTPRKARMDPWNAPGVVVLHALLRVFALSLTAVFALVTAASVRAVPTTTQANTVLARLAVFVPIFAVAIAGVVTQVRYDRVPGPDSTEAEVGAPLEAAQFWTTKRAVTRQWWLHVVTALFVAAWVSEGRDWPRAAGFVVLAVLLATPLLTAFSVGSDIGSVTPDETAPPADHGAAPPRSSVTPSGWRRWLFHAGWIVVIVGLGIGGRWWLSHVDQPRDGGLVAPSGPDPFHILSTLRVLLLVQLALLVAIAVVVVVLNAIAAGNPHHRKLLHGHAVTFVAFLAWLVAGVLSCATVLAAAITLDTPKGGIRTPGLAELVDTAGVTLAAGAAGAVLLLAVRTARSWLFYNQTRLEDRPGGGWRFRLSSALAAEAHEAYIGLVPLALVGAAWLVYVSGALLHWWTPVKLHVLAASFVTVAAVIPVTVKQLRKNSDLRRRVGILWDVITFWPRAVHPLAPPCYAERVVPQLIERHRALRGGAAGTGQVLISAHSQGAVISAAVLFQIPREDLKHTALLTYGCQYSFLFARAFPAYLGGHCLDRLAERLGATSTLDLDQAKQGHLPRYRWLNLYRYTDHLGASVDLRRDYTDHNREVADPPVARARPDSKNPRLALQRPGDELAGDARPDRAPQTHSNYPATYEYAQAVSQLEPLVIPSPADVPALNTT